MNPIHPHASEPEPRRGPCGVMGRQEVLEELAHRAHPACLMCGTENPLGMRLRFSVRPDGSVGAPFPGRQALQSYPETLHGGVISALLDAAMTNALFSVGVVAVTAELTVRFLAPVCVASPAFVRAWVESSSGGPLYGVRAEIEQDQQTKARGSAKFMVRKTSQ